MNSTNDQIKHSTATDGKPPVSKSLNCGMITPQTRLAAACRRFQFESIKSLGVFWLIEKIPGLKIKEPWNKLYQRMKR